MENFDLSVFQNGIMGYRCQKRIYPLCFIEFKLNKNRRTNQQHQTIKQTDREKQYDPDKVAI